MNTLNKISKKTKSDKTKLLNAIDNSDLNTIQKMVKKTKNFSLRESVKSGSLDLVEMLVNQGYKINKAEKLSISRFIAKTGQLEILKFLVDKGIINANNPTMLLISAEKGHLEIVKFLVEQGTDIHVCEGDLMRWTASAGHLDILKFLVDKGADLKKHIPEFLIEYLANKKNCIEVSRYLEENLKK